MSTVAETRNWYRGYYQRKGQSRNDVLLDRGVLFQQFGFEASVTNSLRRAELDPKSAKLLDVGCGSGGSLPRFFQMGFSPRNMYGIDLLQERIEEARYKFPSVNFISGDAAAMPYTDGYFDLVLESTMFVQLTDTTLSRDIAAEMLRVTRPNGYLLLVDWRYTKPGNAQYLGLGNRRIKKLFDVGSRSRIVCQSKGALIPPVGRMLSKYASSLYFLAATILPPLVGQNCTLLQKHAT